MPVVSHALTTLSAVKELLGITNTENDTLLESLIDNVTDFIEGRLGGRRIKKQTYTEEVHDGGEHDIYLNNFPIADSPSLVAEFRTGSLATPTFQTFSINDFVIYNKAGFVHFLGRTPGKHLHNRDRGVFGNPVAGAGDRNLRFTYDGGFDDIPLDLELVARQLVGNLFNRRNSQGIKKESVEGTSIEYFGDDMSGSSLITDEQQLVLNRYKRRNVGQNL